MDQAYRQVADHYGFVCSGCEDNCCRTRFYHHTWVEYFYLRDGLDGMVETQRQKCLQRATLVREKMADADADGEKRRIMCPLNEDGRCVLYERRPMICRLHGLPHFLRRPDGRVQIGPGCGEFENRCIPQENNRLDRTPLYAGLAALEQRVRSHAGYAKKIRMTVADMLLASI